MLPEQAAAGGRVLLEGAGWTEINGEVVCARCLAVAEEWSLAASYIQMVEASVAREQAHGTDPQPHELPLITYAQVLRSRLTDAGAPLPPPPPRVGPGAGRRDTERPVVLRGGAHKRFFHRS
ncbi:MAG: hypothetical protein ACR2KV_01180, partial [Solirubrobacteraceae bacterium]